MDLPTLYKKTKTGKVQYWLIRVFEEHASRWEPADGSPPPMAGVIKIEYGQVGTSAPQKTQETILAGKNAGKKNATTAYQQAELQARSLWTKQIKKGYVEELDRARAGVDNVGGVLPMLAEKYSEQGRKIVFPAMVQPKMDGLRCIATISNGQVALTSKTRKPITSMQHVEAALAKLFAGYPEVILDGELYTHELKDDFEEIESSVRKKEASEGSEQVQYHVFDVVPGTGIPNMSGQSRRDALVHLLSKPVSGPEDDWHKHVKLVNTVIVHSEEQMYQVYDRFLEEGYEGAMVRNIEAVYQHCRTTDLQKLKTFQDSEFTVVDVVEGRGKLAGHGIFVCRAESGNPFRCKMKGDTARLKEYLSNKDKYVGKALTVQYQGISNRNHVPRFPVALRFREEE